jgi:hypothetical protein
MNRNTEKKTVKSTKQSRKAPSHSPPTRIWSPPRATTLSFFSLPPKWHRRVLRMWLSAHDTTPPHQRRLLRAFRRQDRRRTRHGSIDRRILVRKHAERTRRLRTAATTTATTTWIAAVAVRRGRRVRRRDADLPFGRHKDRVDAGSDADASRRRGRRIERRDVVLEYAFVRPRRRVHAHTPGRRAAVARCLWSVP